VKLDAPGRRASGAICHVKVGLGALGHGGRRCRAGILALAAIRSSSSVPVTVVLQYYFNRQSSFFFSELNAPAYSFPMVPVPYYIHVQINGSIVFQEERATAPVHGDG
jgi:hypothetical protein